MIHLTDQPLDIASITASVQADEAGAIDVFIGTVRNNTKEKKVVRLEFEAYDSMALREMEKIAAQVRAKWPVAHVAIHHRKGVLQIGDVAVIIAVSTPHRSDAFAACRFAIDTLKETVPIWKKEVFEDGAVWVAAHP